VTAAAASTSAPRQVASDVPLAATPAAAAPVASTPLAAPSAPVDVQLPMAPDAAAFGEAFATQVSVLARDGVQQAELHLNPAETGPVSIQMVLYGKQARIDFGADALPTRQAIEQSLPELAAALREQGLTLSGGGVSEHSRGREPQAPDAAAAGPARRSGDTTAAAPVLHSVRTPRSAGGIDLYA
jgi:flagellar hook-length control protein FliK